jgi:hypothetical protein
MEVVEALDAQALALAEPEGGPSGPRHVTRRILTAVVLGFAMFVVLAGRARADMLDPAQSIASTATDTVGQAVETTTDGVDPIVESAIDAVEPTVGTATDAAGPVVGAVTDRLDPVTEGLGPVREAAETVLPGTKGVVPKDLSNPLPQPPIPGVTHPNRGIPPAPQASPGRASADSIPSPAGSGRVSGSSMLSAVPRPATNTKPSPSSGTPRGFGGHSLPFGPFGRGIADGPLVLLVLSAALAASLTLRPPPIRSLLASHVVAPNGAALALSVERPG